jgi:hypothetical protein
MSGSDHAGRATLCSVDAELFDSLEAAIAFVAERGGGVVYTELADSLLAHMIGVPDNVRLIKSRKGPERRAPAGRKPAPPGRRP